MVLIEEIIRRVIERCVCFASTKLQPILELEPTQTREGVQTQAAALCSIPRCTCTCRSRSAIICSTATEQA
jgi:hypothetical protein